MVASLRAVNDFQRQMSYRTCGDNSLLDDLITGARTYQWSATTAVSG
jgi:hypothetical protein